MRRIKVCNPEMLLIAPLSLSSVPLQAALVHYCIIRKHILWEVYVCVCVKIDNGCNLSRSEAYNNILLGDTSPVDCRDIAHGILIFFPNSLQFQSPPRASSRTLLPGTMLTMLCRPITEE